MRVGLMSGWPGYEFDANTMKKTLLILLWFCPLSTLAQAPQWDDTKKAEIDAKCEEYFTTTFMVYQAGELKYSYGDSEKKFRIFSVRKSLVSMLYGIYENEGLIDTDATLEELGIDDIHQLTKEEKQATVFNLLQARSGVYHSAAFETSSMKRNRPERGSHAPGTFWYYNNWDFNALTTIFEQSTSKTIFEAFEEKIARPLGLKDFDIKDQEYVLESENSKHKATLWRLSGRDLLSIGLMALDKGKANGKEVVPAEWMVKSTTPYSDIGRMGGYGLCWWLATNGQHYPFVTLTNQSFMAIGTGMQHLIVIPEYEMVIVHQTNIQSPQDPRMKVTQLSRMLKRVMDQ